MKCTFLDTLQNMPLRKFSYLKGMYALSFKYDGVFTFSLFSTLKNEIYQAKPFSPFNVYPNNQSYDTSLLK